MQKKLKISIKDFIEINDLYGPTKIEIIPIKNVYGKFINIKGNQKNLYHIYFNDSKIEIKNKYSINEEDKITKIKVKIDYRVDSFWGLFNECNCIESIDFNKYCRRDKSWFEYMFSKCSSIKELSLSNIYNNNISALFFRVSPTI